jgi:medium-chain acyl-[acyl-carrier-protein] hydrolase
MRAVFPTPWLTVDPRPNARIRLFCFPYAGGGASIFRTWPAEFSQTVEACSVRFPGRESRIREAPFAQLAPLVEALAEVLLPYLDKPFAFFGHSMGALVGFELARLLRRRPVPAEGRALSPARLFVSGRNAPHTPDGNPPLHALPEAEFLEELRRLNGIPGEAFSYPELIQLMLPTLRADFTVCETYAYSIEPPLDCPISAFGGLGDSRVSQDNLQAWRDQTSADFSLQMFPGDHFFLHTAQSLLLRTLNRELDALVSTV